MRPPARSVVLVAAVLSVVPLLAGCGAPDYQYVRSPLNETGFKLPASWTVYDGSLLTGSAVLTPTEGSIEWVVGFDASPNPSAGNVVGSVYSPISAYPTGIARLDSFALSEGETLDLNNLRNLVIPIDLLLRDEEDKYPDDVVSVDVYDPTLFRNGLRGELVEYKVLASALADVRGTPLPEDEADGYVHVSQLAYAQESVGIAFVVAVMCSESCFERHREEIDTVIDSWTVLP